MSKVLVKSQESVDKFEKAGKKFLKSGWYDYVGFIVFFFGDRGVGHGCGVSDQRFYTS